MRDIASVTRPDSDLLWGSAVWLHCPRANY